MMSTIEIVKTYVNAWNAKEVDKIIGMFAEDAVMSSPMGPQKGKAQIRSSTSMFLAMTAKQTMTEPYEEAGVVHAKIKAPVGMVTLAFKVESGLIQRIDAKIGLR